MRRLSIAAALCLSLAASAQSAQDELERQLKEMVAKPPTKLLIEYEGLDQPNYKLVEASFDLDGSPMSYGPLDKLNSQGKHLIFHGESRPGKHTVEATVVITDVSGAIFSNEAGFKWKVKKSISYEQQAGLEVQILIEPELNPGEKDPKKKFGLKTTSAVKMLAKLEDGTMPAVPKPNLQVAKEEADAGSTVVAELTPAEKAKLAKQQADEEKKQKAADAVAAKKATAEEKKQKAADAAAAKKAAAEEKKQKAADAAAAKKQKAADAAAAKTAAAEEKKRAAAEAVAAAEAKAHPKAANDPEKQNPVADAPVDAGAAVVAAIEVVDAGAPAAVAVAEPPPAVKPSAPEPAPASEGSGLPLPLPVLAGIGIALLGLIIFLATRKKSPPQA